jgi:hypothetical protein
LRFMKCFAMGSRVNMLVTNTRSVHFQTNKQNAVYWPRHVSVRATQWMAVGSAGRLC